jgi:hypothetical protein
VNNDEKGGAYLGRFRPAGKVAVKIQATNSFTAKSTRTVVKVRPFKASGNAVMVQGRLRYCAQRANEQGERQERDIFNNERDEIPRSEAARDLNRAIQETTQREGIGIILSPDTSTETAKENLRDWTREMMLILESKHDMKWCGVVHAAEGGHSGHGHVHVVAVSDRRITKDELATLRQHGDAHWKDIKQRQQLSEKDQIQRHTELEAHKEKIGQQSYSSGLEL